MSLATAPPIVFLATVNMDRCQDFYELMLGLPLVEHEPTALVFDANGIMLRVSPVASVTPQSYTVLGWAVDDLAGTIGTLNEAGVTFVRFDELPQDHLGIWTAPDGSQIAWFHDPDGHLLSLTQW